MRIGAQTAIAKLIGAFLQLFIANAPNKATLQRKVFIFSRTCQGDMITVQDCIIIRLLPLQVPFQWHVNL
jgi:hypothetical protein